MPSLPFSWLPLASLITLVLAVAYRVTYRIWFHPLAKFPGPWYGAATSLSMSIVCLLGIEHEWLLRQAKKYGKDGLPVRVTPDNLMFCKPSALKDIYSDYRHNTKSQMYTSGALGPTNLFSTADADEHRALRKALGGPQWSIGALKNNWEARIDELLRLLVAKLAEQPSGVALSDRLPEFAADVLTLVTFTEPWGFVRNGRDEGGLLHAWRQGLPFFGFAARCAWFRRNVLTSPRLAPLFLPRTSDDRGMGFLMRQADRAVGERERRIDEEGFVQEKPDYLQYCLEARIKGEPLTPVQKRAQCTLLFQAGADTTGTGLGSILRFVATHPRCLARARAELDRADAAGLLSDPVQLDEVRAHLPYAVACIREGHRLHPPVTNFFPRVVPAGGRVVDGVGVPGGADVACVAYVVQRDPVLFGPDPEAFRPERWLPSEEGEGEGGADAERRVAAMEAGIFAFGMGPRICLGKEVAIMETYKVVPEILRRFDIDVVSPGEYVVAGGISFNDGFIVNLKERRRTATATT